MYEEQKHFNDAINNYKKAIKYDSTYVKAHYNLGCVLDYIGQTQDAILSFKQAINYNPKQGMKMKMAV